jgi:hypothetical protein
VAFDGSHLPDPIRAALYPLLNNLYFVHLDILEVCAKWIPRREADDERIWLAAQLYRETREVPMYREYVGAVGYSPNRAIRIPDSENRYRELKDTEDEVDVIVGMNVIAQSVIGTIEHRQLCTFDPVFFAPLVEVLAFEAGNLERVQVMLRRRDPSHIEMLLAKYYEHLITVTKPEIMPLLEPVIALGIFADDIIEQGLARLAAIADAVGVNPPAGVTL